MGYALFYNGTYYTVTDVNGLLRMMRESPDFRTASIEMLKSYCYRSDKVRQLVEAGYLEVRGEPGKEEKMDEMTRSFAALVRKEFPEEWEKTRIVA